MSSVLAMLPYIILGNAGILVRISAGLIALFIVVGLFLLFAYMDHKATMQPERIKRLKKQCYYLKQRCEEEISLPDMRTLQCYVQQIIDLLEKIDVEI